MLSALRTDATYAGSRAWISLVAGAIAVAFGIALMVDGGLGVSPVDVFFVGLSTTLGVSIGVAATVASLLMVTAAWLCRVRPGVGTLVTLLLIGPTIDLVRLVVARIDPQLWAAPLQIMWWVTGLAVFTLGVLLLFAARLGVSPYDMLTQAVSKLSRLSLARSRLLLDGVFVAAGLLLSGPLGVGTALLWLAVPVALARLLPAVQRWVDVSRRETAPAVALAVA